MKLLEVISIPIQDVKSYILKFREICLSHGLDDPIEHNMIKIRDDGERILYEFENKNAHFPEKAFFKMRLFEKGSIPNNSIVDILKYTYHGYYMDTANTDFIRFDFEPATRKYAPLHINADRRKWGDHLTFPNGTNLDISKIDLEKALLIFELYSDNKNCFPLDQQNNQSYVNIIEGVNKNE